MTKAKAIFTGGIHNLMQLAVREDGLAFRRHQKNTHFGYRWGAWKATGETYGENRLAATDEIVAGFSTLRRASANDAFINNRALFNNKGDIRVRLP